MESLFDALVSAAERAPVVGWDLSPMRDRWISRGPPGDHRKLVAARPVGTPSWLDRGTGGGEFLATRAPLPLHPFAAEVRRVLRPGGCFITQPVGAGNSPEINDRLVFPPAPPTNALGRVDELSREVSRAGLTVTGARSAMWTDEA